MCLFVCCLNFILINNQHIWSKVLIDVCVWWLRDIYKLDILEIVMYVPYGLSHRSFLNKFEHGLFNNSVIHELSCFFLNYIIISFILLACVYINIWISYVYAYIPKTVVTFYSRIIHELYVYVFSVCCLFSLFSSFSLFKSYSSLKLSLGSLM